MPQIIENVACTVCGCVCDDLRCTVVNGRIVSAEGACKLAEPWYLSQDSEQPPASEIDGRAVTMDEALTRAAEILAGSRAPLVYGLSRSSTAGQQAACALADLVGATIDTTASLCHAPSILAFQQVGESTCSLGEIRNRADLVVFWGCNPVDSHPRHFERYSVDALGEFIPRGRADRTIVVADVQPTATSRVADIFVQIEPERDFEALWTLRGLLQGSAYQPDAQASEFPPRAEPCVQPVTGVPPPCPSPTGAPLSQLRDLAQRMKSCRCGIVFFGLGLSRSGMGHLNVNALLSLVRDLNAYTRFHARRMRVVGDVAGADSVLTWQTGYPFSVNLSRGYPRFNPGEFSAQELLERGEPDACLLLGSEGVEWFSPRAVDALRRIPVIAIDHPTVKSAIPPAVRFTTAVYGIHRAGTAYRMDEIPIPLRAILPSQYPSDDEILKRLRKLIGNGCNRSAAARNR